MKTFHATKVAEDSIELKSFVELEALYQAIKDEENFILVWYEGDVQRSEIVVANNLVSKVHNGDIKLTAKEPRRTKE